MRLRSLTAPALVLVLLVAPLAAPGALGLLGPPEEEGPVDATVTVRPVCPLPELCPPHEMRMYTYTWAVQACVEEPRELAILLVVEQEPNLRVEQLAPRSGEEPSCFSWSHSFQRVGPDCVCLSALLTPGILPSDPQPSSFHDDDAECVVLGVGPVQVPVISDG